MEREGGWEGGREGGREDEGGREGGVDGEDGREEGNWEKKGSCARFMFYCCNVCGIWLVTWRAGYILDALTNEVCCLQIGSSSN